ALIPGAIARRIARHRLDFANRHATVARMSHQTRRVGLLGLGAIGRPVARALATGMPGLTLIGATARDAGRARAFLGSLPGSPPLLGFEGLLERADIVVEAATRAALIVYAPALITEGRELLRLFGWAIV